MSEKTTIRTIVIGGVSCIALIWLVLEGVLVSSIVSSNQNKMNRATMDVKIGAKKDGTIQIKGKDITVLASGETNVKADKNITMKGQKILQN